MPPWSLRTQQRSGEPASEGRWAWLVWGGALTVVTVGLLPFRELISRAHVALVYLLVVLGASAGGGRVRGTALTIIAFLCFDFFFLEPYQSFAVADPLDWLVLLAFLTASAVATHLLALAQSEAAAAQRRAAEVERLSSLGAETLNVGRAEDALAAIAAVIRTTLDVERCEIYLRDGPSRAVTLAAESHTAPPASAADAMSPPEPDGARSSSEDGPGLPDDARLVESVAESGRAVVRRSDGTMRFADVRPASPEHPAQFSLSGARTLLLPLRVRDRTVGVLRVVHLDTLALDAPQQRFLEALSYYAALGVERVRLVAAAEHAEALRQADQLKDALLASVSHDLRTPLTTIKALAHRIGAEGDARAITIEEEADRLNRFVADLLDLSRLAGGALAVAPELTAAEDLVGAALQRVSGAQGDRAIDVSLDPREPLLLGRFDFVHSLRVLVNLIENALKYSPPGTAVELTARRVGGVLEFVVADRGPGVPPAEEPRIFEPFYRPPGSPPDAGSAGLGLSIARRLAEVQGGSLRYEPREGGGSRFVFCVPAVELADLGAGPAAQAL